MDDPFLRKPAPVKIVSAGRSRWRGVIPAGASLVVCGVVGVGFILVDTRDISHVHCGQAGEASLHVANTSGHDEVRLQERPQRGKSGVQWILRAAYLTIFLGCIWHGFRGDIAIGGGADGEGACPLPCLSS
ncbi:MAG: hypothetical protein PWR16_869 [Methanoculleus sp.]|nr:hypothetical protein [Methanoculleus sp.]